MNNKDKNPVFILGLFDTGVYTARLLRNKNIPILGFDYDEENPGFYSNIIEAIKILNPIENNDIVISSILNYRRKFKKKPILIAASEIFLSFIEKNREVLEQEFLFLLPPNNILKRILNRAQQFQLAKNCGINVPKFFLVNTKSELENTYGKITFPIMVRGVDQVKWKLFTKKKAFYYNNYEPFYKDLLNLIKNGIGVLIEEIIEGDINNNFEYNALFNNGKIIEFNINQKLRQYPIDFGSACHLRNVINEKVQFLGEKFVIKNNIEGFSNTEFKYSSNEGEYYFIETNVRVWQQIELTKKINQNFVLLYYNILTSGDSIYNNRVTKFKSIHWIDLPTFVLLFFKFRKKICMNFLNFFKSIIKAKYYGLIDIRDMRPFLKSIKIFR